MQRTISAKRCLEPFCNFERMSHAFGISRFLSVQANYVRNEAVVSGTEQPKHVQQASQRPRGICASAKSEYKNLVTILIDIHQVAICIAYIRKKAGSEREPHYHRPGF